MRVDGQAWKGARGAVAQYNQAYAELNGVIKKLNEIRQMVTKMNEMESGEIITLPRIETVDNNNLQAEDKNLSLKSNIIG